jgi:hypothetical protein
MIIAGTYCLFLKGIQEGCAVFRIKELTGSNRQLPTAHCPLPTAQ